MTEQTKMNYGIYRDGSLCGGGPDKAWALRMAEGDFKAGKGRDTIEVRDQDGTPVLTLAATDPRPKVKGLECPEGLSGAGKAARRIAVNLLTISKLTNTGGCRAFYTPAEWEEHEDRKVGGELVIVYDGGDVTALCDGFLREHFQRNLRGAGMHFEPYNSWFGVVYTD